MTLNTDTNIIKKISNLSADEVNTLRLEMYLVSKEFESENYYRAIKTELSDTVIKWLRKNLINEINELKVTNEDDELVFAVGDYNFEISVQDTIAKFKYTSSPIENKAEGLISTLIGEGNLEKITNTNFQSVKATLNNQVVYFFYYRSLKKDTARKRKRRVVRDSNVFHFIEEPIIDVGGSLDFFILDDFVYIINLRAFEFAFGHADHINTKRDINLAKILEADFFDNPLCDRALFKAACEHSFYSKSIAQIKEETINALVDNFEKRCDELKVIKSNLPTQEEQQNEYKKKLGLIWDLISYIDLNEKKIIYQEGQSVKPLIHFFADKIAKSFLTEDIRVVLGYEK